MRRFAGLPIAFRVGLGVCIAGALGMALERVPLAQEKTPRDGVYSPSQAARGKAQYAASCASCHMDDLSGTLSGDTGAPPLRGEPFVAFVEGWDARRLFDYIKTTMPADEPASLRDDTYLDILTFLFQANGYPAGSEPLGLSQLGAIRLAR